MKASFCPHCGAEVSNNYVFCPNCGTELPEMSAERVTPPVTEENKSEVLVQRKTQQNKSDVAGTSLGVNQTVVCPTCGFENLAGSRSCESCGAFLKGADRDLSLPQAPLEREESAASKSRRQDLPQTEPKETPVRKEKPKATTAPDAFPKKRFHFGTTQMVVVVATLCLGTILVYGIMTTKSVAPQQNDTSSTDVQQQATANQPSADVLHEIDRLRQVVDKNPSDVVSTLRLSNMLQDNGFYDQAVVYYKRYVEKMPDNVDARVDYGVTLFEGGHAQDAISQLTRALDINPRHQIGYFNLGIVYLNTGEFDKASVAFKKCVSVDPNSDIGKKAEQTLEQHANMKN